MQFDFLEAAGNLPLTKTFYREDGVVKTEPYPMVRRLNSYREDCADISELFEVMQRHSEAGRCMLKGLLDRTLKDESRAGHTSPEQPTRWLCLDLDFSEGWSSPENFLAELNPDWANVSYIWQHSASAGIRYPAGIRGHLWLWLDDAIHPALLKHWLQERNLDIQRLSQQFELATSGVALKWPLDITTCQNDKLLYIAPPKCMGGVEDPLAGQRFELKVKDKLYAPIPETRTIAATIEHRTQEKVNELRRGAGLPARKPKLIGSGAELLLANPERGTVTGAREGRGFVYLNLNGGNSWAYFFPKSNPEILRNFKGEPNVRLRDIAPEFYADYVAKLQRERYGDLTPYVFREPQRDAYYNVLYSPSRDRVELIAQASGKEKLADFMTQFGRTMPDPVEDWAVEYDPRSTKVIDPAMRWVNMFRPTDYVRMLDAFQDVEKFGNITEVPPVIDKILTSVCGNDEEAKQHFLNWLAFVFQTRERANTAWIFHGVQGTGKGVLLNKILRPLLGNRHVTEWTSQAFEEKYNQQLETTSLLWLDEFKATDSKNDEQVMNKLKNYVTEEILQIRAMRQNMVEVSNFLNVIIACNHPDPVRIPEHDRRFNVAPPQECAIKLTETEVDEIEEELPGFACFLAQYPMDRAQARRVLLNTARDAMIVASQTTTEQFFAMLRSGRFAWFAEYLQPSMPVHDTLAYQSFEEVMRRWGQELLANYDTGNPIRVTREDMRTAYAYIIGTPTKPSKFTRMMSIHRIKTRQVRVGNEAVTGAMIPFHMDKTALEQFVAEKGRKLKIVGDKE